jgi:hypothetical protein
VVHEEKEFNRAVLHTILSLALQKIFAMWKVLCDF